jgi:hypothetical protein
MGIQSYVADLAAAGLHQDANGVWHGPLAVLPGGTPSISSTTGTISTQTSLTIAGAANAYTVLNGLYVSGTGLPAALGAAMLTITGGNASFLRNLWTGPALGLDANVELPGWGLVSSAQNTSLVITVAAITLVTVSITALVTYI